MADPDRDPQRKLELVRDLMRARRAVKETKSSGELAAEAAAHKAGRDPAGIRRYLSMDAAPDYSFAELSSFTESARRAHDLGFTDVIVHWPRASRTYAGDETVLDRIADLLVDGQYRP